MTSSAGQKARTPEEISTLFVQRLNDRDADGMAELYAPDAVMAYPPGQTTVGRDAIRAVLAEFAAHARLPVPPEESLPAIGYGNLALTSTPSKDGTGVRVQVTQRQSDGSWLRIIDQPESHPQSRSQDRPQPAS
ncbi:MAG TPA: nuclear transport factor 2 family protein [Streptosporangiaceae bacterium]